MGKLQDLGAGVKAFLEKDKIISEMVASGILKNYAKWGATGAGIGAVVGAVDQIGGEGRFGGPVGGAFRGAFYGVGARGAKHGYDYFMKGSMARTSSPTSVKSVPRRPGQTKSPNTIYVNHPNKVQHSFDFSI